jgi:hypothetical protein
MRSEVKQSEMVISFLSGREGTASTEVFLSIVDADEPALFIDLWSRGSGRIGVAELRLCGSEPFSSGRTAGLYELVKLHGEHFQAPGPTVSLKGVLWPRREVLLQLEEGCSSLPQAGRNLESSQ